MNKRSISVMFFICGFFSINASAEGADSMVPFPFQGFDDTSSLTIDYTDLDSLLDALVLYTGRSSREKASLSRAATGTRMKVSVNRSTVNEGNRFFFEVFVKNDTNKQTLANIQNRLEHIPMQMPLSRFSRDEQLAYWINLYNTTMLYEIVKIYPEHELEDLLVGKESILSEKILMVEGVQLSLNDIQFTILKQNYDSNPLIIYGLYQGIIGSPNIRKSAYTGKYVYGDLIDNAMEFINSNRGTESKNERVFRVSSLYARNASYFDDFDADLKTHLLVYLEGEQQGQLQAATEIEPDIDDWSVTNLYGDQRAVAGSLSNSSAALVGAASGSGSSRVSAGNGAAGRFSPEVLARLNELNQNGAQEKTGVVSIEELGQTPDQTDTADAADINESEGN